MINKLFKIIETKYSFLIYTVLFFFTMFLFSDSVLHFDDIFYHFFVGGIKFSKQFEYGSWAMNLQNILMYYIPFKLHINIQDWAASFGVLFKSCIFVLMSFFISKFFIKENYTIKLKSILILLSYILLFTLYITKRHLCDFVIFEGFFRFILPALLLVISLYLIYKILHSKEINIYFAAILALITAWSSEIAAVIGLTVCICSLIYQFLNKKKVKPLVFILSGLILGTTILVSSAGFHLHFEVKLCQHTFSITSILSSLPEFTASFIKQIFINYSIFFLCFGYLTYKNLKKYRDERDIINTTFCLSILLGILVFSFSLIILGKSYYLGGYWIDHRDIYAVYFPLMSIVFLIQFCNFIEKYNNQKRCLTILFALLLIPFLYTCIHLRSIMTTGKSMSYLRDKIYLFYSYQNKSVKLPASCYLNSIWSIMYKPWTTFDSFIYNYKTTRTKIFEDINFERYDKLENYYYPIMYGTTPKDINTNLFIGVDNKKYMKMYVNEGGTFSEIYTGKYKFKDLEDKDFVLNLKSK